MKLTYKIHLVLAFLSLFKLSAQQIITDDSLPLSQLIQDNLGQNCVEISNISSIVNGTVNGINSFGYFERGNSNFPFESGIVLTTGNVNSAGNIVNSSPLNEGTPSWGTDIDLETALDITNTLNATSIQFHFTSVANRIQFNYILASEEYQQDFPCRYSDGFAFLIREANSTGPYTNIALVPNTSTPVNTMTIRPQMEGFCGPQNDEYFGGFNMGDTNYNGQTVVLTASANIQPNVEYEIKLIIADQSDQNYDSAVFIEGNSFNANVDLGPDIETCGSSITLNGDIQNPLATYQWFQDNIVLPGENNPTLEVLTSGTYKVEITILVNENYCIIEDSVEIILNTEQPSTSISDFIFCDENDDDTEVFDLSLKDSEVLASVPPSTYNITYHYTLEDAQSGENPILDSIENTSSPQPIYVRIEDTENGCLAFSTFNLVVNEKPEYEDPDPIIVCQDPNSSGFTLIDLTATSDEITNGNSDIFVSYHFSLPEADLGVNPFYSPYENPNISEILYIRVYNSVTGCFSTTSVSIQIQQSPTVNPETQWINACEQDENGFETFDLTSVIDDVLEGQSGVDISFHELYDDALSNINPISDPQNYVNTNPNFQLIYIRVEDPITGCFTITKLELHTKIIETGFSTEPYTVCDDASNDGIADFNLYDVESHLMNGYEPFEFIFFESEDDRENNINALNKEIPYNVTNTSTTLYAVVSDDECSENLNVLLVIAPAIILVPQSVDYCDEDNDGYTTLIMDTFNAVASQGIPSANINYYLTENDAINDENRLPELIYNDSNPQLLYIRVTNAQTECYNISTLEVNIVNAPEVSNPEPIIVCDDDNDGISTVNLETKIPEIITSALGFDISFYNDYNSALEGTNEIPVPQSYTTSSEYIYARVENEITGCFSLAEFEIYINTLPQFVPISDYENCEADISGVADFYFSLKDDEILNGQPGKQVLYYETASDALTGTNPIDKYSSYQNTASPQTIYVRVESLTDSNCFGTSSFELIVGSIPIFNPPQSIFICDDISNDGFATIDLNETIAEIIAGSPETLEVTFHTSEFDATNNLNPLPLEYTNTTNPQEIFTRIDNGNYCKGIAAFGINVISAPIVNYVEPIARCDNDYDGILIWDLTVSEIDILDVRQENIEVSYFESIEDLENNVNPISNPENYANITNPQTVYVKVNNIISDCFITVPLDLVVNIPPPFNDFEVYNICENPTNNFDLSEIDSILINPGTPAILTYFETNTNAENSTNPLDYNYIYTSTNDTIFVRIEHPETGCYYIYDFILNVNPAPIANQPSNLIVCDDDYDGYFEFDLSQVTPQVLGFQNPNNFEVSYHNSQIDANDALNEINDLLYNGFDGEIITARIENLSSGCYDIIDFSLVVNRKPFVDIPQQTVCIDNLPLVVSANTFNPTDTYLWSTNHISPSVEITEIGTYSVTITSEYGCSTTSTFEVIESESATIELTETVDFSDPNNIIITISGIGNYLYILDDGVPQDSNVFENVALGYHTITIIDLNGCAEVTKEVLVIDAPKFFTPNGDTQNDTWHIIGIETLPGSIVYIFDRYGKLLKQLNYSSIGWNGTYNGHNMPATDYWFLAEIRQGEIEFDVRGHFALRR